MVAIYWFIFETNFFNLDWYSCFIVGEEIWLEGFFGIFKDHRNVWLSRTSELCVRRKNTGCSVCIVEGEHGWCIHIGVCINLHVCLCACFHRCILKATSPVTVPGYLEKFLACQRCLEKLTELFKQWHPFVGQPCISCFINWHWKLAFQPYPTNWYAPWRRKNIQQLQFPKQRCWQLQHVHTCSPISYHWMTVGGRRSFVCV